ncbi:hypothetical protein CRUP_019427 [Coryphaenoides rupestris]|nr:hypothetical protein CRUP_019427 [Coryphaenoides rupestris]
MDDLNVNDALIHSVTNAYTCLLNGSPPSRSAAPEILQKLLVAFDAHLTLLVFTFLPGENVDEGPSGVCDTHRGRGVTLSSLLTLLEVLCASRLRCSTGVCTHSQRLVYTRARGLIKMAASSSCDYYVKRQVLLLMKRTLLQKAGEDMALGETSAAAPRDEHFAADMEALADTTLRALSADWLQFVPVETTTASSFGGSGPGAGQGEGQALKPDHVMLRAVGLVVLKSLELALQPGAGADGAVGACLGALLGFLRDRGVPLMEPSHRCCWFTLVFAEQDDDMMEAAKTLLTLYLRDNSRCPGSDPEAASGTSGTPCASGFNPHCHFLLFLRSVSFDHSTLLDFLISSETCFLEYLVRYLKHLRADSPGFSLACRKMEESDTYVRARLSCSASRADAAPAPAPAPLPVPVPVRVGEQGTTQAHPGLDRPGPSAQPTGLGSGLCLVDYSSSDDEDAGPEDMEVSQASHQYTDEGNMRSTIRLTQRRRCGPQCVTTGETGRHNV